MSAQRKLTALQKIDAKLNPVWKLTSEEATRLSQVTKQGDGVKFRYPKDLMRKLILSPNPKGHFHRRFLK